MCLFVVKQYKMAGISTEEGGVSTDIPEALIPSDVSTPSRQRRPEIQVRRNEMESVTDVVRLTSNLDDATYGVATINIGNTKAIRSWILTLDKQFGMYLICGLRFVNFQL